MACEPLHSCIRVLKALYGRNAKVSLVPKAVGSASGTKRLHVCGSSPTLTTLSEKWIETVGRAHIFQGIRWNKGVAVEVTTLDRLIEAFGEPDFVKIDVEGFEDLVLQGATGLLEQSTPIVIVECNPDGPYRQVQALLEPHGYRFFRITDQGPRKMERIEADATERFRNVLCLPPNVKLP